MKTYNNRRTDHFLRRFVERVKDQHATGQATTRTAATILYHNGVSIEVAKRVLLETTK